MQLDTERYNLVAAMDSLAIAKIALARVIGLQPGQSFEATNSDLSTTQTVSPLNALVTEAQRQRAYSAAAERTLEAAELSLSAIKGQRIPEITTEADYGDIGTTFGHSHGTFDVSAGVNFPVFTGGRIKGQVQQAEALVEKRGAELKNLRAQVDADVRTAYLNLNAARDQVQVAQHNVVLGPQASACAGPISEWRDRQR